MSFYAGSEGRCLRTQSDGRTPDTLHEECGVFGVYAPRQTDIAGLIYYGLYSLQHRGQESCGIVVNDDGVFVSHKDLGLVNEVFGKDVLRRLPTGRLGVGHVRYGTTGGTDRANCQPIEINHSKGRLALAHNGNISNAYDLRCALESRGAIFHTTSDTETIAYIVTQERLCTPSIQEAVSRAMYRLDGAYSMVLMSAAKLIAVRDPHGFRPLCYGVMPDGTYIVASESCALGAVGARFERDILPGEILVFDENGVHSDTSHCAPHVTCGKHTCVFEYIYFARPDSVIDGVSVHAARQRAGQVLARRHPAEADVVIGVPDSGLDAALGYAAESGLPDGIGFVKNRYIGRTFISPGQDQRINLVRIKLSPVTEVVAGKRVVLVDDSIVRGTTSRQIVSLLRDAGATEVHMRISAPPFLNPCYYGTDIDSRDHLIAAHHTVEETAAIIGVDTLGYLPDGDLPVLVNREGQTCEQAGLCHACFCGHYPTAVPEHTEKDRFEAKLSDKPAKPRSRNRE